MPVDYNAKDASNCLPADTYDAELVKVEDKKSKVKPDGSGGNPMQVWTFRVFGDREVFVTEHVVIPAATFKIKQLAKALGREDDFKANRFQADDYIGAGVKLALVIETQEGFDEKNKVAKFLPAGEAEAAPPARTLPPRPTRQPVTSPISDEQKFKDDDIPF